MTKKADQLATLAALQAAALAPKTPKALKAVVEENPEFPMGTKDGRKRSFSGAYDATMAKAIRYEATDKVQRTVWYYFNPKTTIGYVLVKKANEVVNQGKLLALVQGGKVAKVA